MIKLMGLLLLFSSAVLTGFYASAALGEREETIYRQMMFWRQFAMQLECLQSTPQQLVHIIAVQEEFSSDRFFRKLDTSFGDSGSFKEALKKALKANPCVSDCGIIDILVGLGDVVGIQQMESQLMSLTSAVMLLEEKRALAQSEYRQKGGLYRRLGILSGILLAVLFF